ncbi:hypothetical protein DY000_02040482 [Brassica cretica]|uniref:Uncharacterized protein n=1 Tax=Brassica cretica TaxID=69181 RepID=A0ABQ7BAI4_BRACR|nr:hypothetical protein DY000_02040482 [Brassica cretica]
MSLLPCGVEAILLWLVGVDSEVMYVDPQWFWVPTALTVVVVFELCFKDLFELSFKGCVSCLQLVVWLSVLEFKLCSAQRRSFVWFSVGECVRSSQGYGFISQNLLSLVETHLRLSSYRSGGCGARISSSFQIIYSTLCLCLEDARTTASSVYGFSYTPVGLRAPLSQLLTATIGFLIYYLRLDFEQFALQSRATDGRHGFGGVRNIGDTGD